MKRTVQRARQQAKNVPACPNSLAELQVPEEYRRTSAGQDFLLHDSGPDDGDQRMLVFATADSLDLLEQSNQWYSDGTFKCVPRLFTQLYSIHGRCGDAVVPLVYALLPNKQQQTYVRLLNAIADARPACAPQSITVDFEAGAINAFKEKYPAASVRGCFFHLCQNVFRHVQSYGLQQRYAEDLEFALEIRKLTALAFVPEADVIERFELLEQSDSFPQEADAVLDYFEDYYIGRRRHGQRRTPMFPIPLWNVHESTLEGLPRTNNTIEGWHR